MANLKPGWKRVKFGEVVRLVKETCKDPVAAGIDRVIGLEHLEPGDLRVRSWNDIADGTTFTTRVRPGQVLFGKRRAYQRKVAVADFDAICSGDIYVFETANPQRLLPELLPFLCQTEAFFEYAVGTSAGSLSPRTNWSSLAEYEFALPPLEEQRRMALLLLAATKNVEASRNLVGAANTTRIAAREALIDRTSFPARTVGSLCEMQNGRPFSSSEYGKSGIRLLRPANLAQDGTLDWRDERTMFMPEVYRTEAANFVISSGDLVINLTAQSLEDGFMGRVCFARSGEACLLNQRIGRFVRFREALLPEYLFRVLQGARFQAHAKAMCEGTKVKHIFWRHIEVFKFPLPPLHVQQEACEHMNAADIACGQAVGRAHQVGRLASEMLNGAFYAATS